MLKSTKVNFKVRMNGNEESKPVDVKFVVSFVGVADEDIRKAAIANQVVSWQSQIRSNWDKFISGQLPKVITFGQPLFAKKRTTTVVRPPTEAEVQAQAMALFAQMTPDEIVAFVQTKKLPERLIVK